MLRVRQQPCGLIKDEDTFVLIYDGDVHDLYSVFIVPSSNLFPKSLNEPKPHALASTPATPKKNVSCFFDLAGGNFFLKMERTFFFGVLPSQHLGRGGGVETDPLGKQKNYFFLI